MNNADDFVGDLFPSHKDVRVVLREASDSEKSVKRALEFVTVNESEFAHAQRQIAITVRLALVNHNAARAVHRLYAIHFVVDDRGIHIVFIVIPVTARFPKMTVHNHRRGHFDVMVAGVNFAPVIYERVFDCHTVW